MKQTALWLHALQDMWLFNCADFTWDTRVTPTTIKWFCQRNLNEQAEGSSRFKIGLGRFPFQHQSELRWQIFICCIWSLLRPFCDSWNSFLLPWAIKYNPGYGYARDALWLNSPRGKKIFEMCFQLQFEVQSVQVLELFLHLLWFLLLSFFFLYSVPQRANVSKQSNLWKHFIFQMWAKATKTNMMWRLLLQMQSYEAHM